MRNKGDKKKRSKRVAIVLACILIPVGAFGFGYFLKDDKEDHQVAHTLNVNGDITGSVIENVTAETTGIVPGDQVEATVNIKPESSADSLLRVKVVPYWMNDSGEKDANLSNDNLSLVVADSVKTDLSAGSWYKSGDYYYYINVVKNSSEINLIKGAEFLILDDKSYDANIYQNKKVGLEVTMEMVQSNGKVYKTKWNLDSKNENDKKVIDALDVYAKESKKIK